MKILLLPNALKGSLSALKAGTVLEKTLKRHHTVRLFPLSDGGDGFLDFFQLLDPHAKHIYITAKNAFLKNIRTSFLLLSDKKTAVIETARICGLGQTPRRELDPMGASSYGVGQVILKAIQKGARRIYVGLGGVACNDGGAGMVDACGGHLLDRKNRPLALGARPLLQLTRLDLSPLQRKLKGIKIIGVADVTNPLLGPKSSAKVFGPQKGATASEVKLLDKAMTHWAQAIRHATGKNISSIPSTAAAGAIAAGLHGCLNGSLILGTDFLTKKLSLEKQIRWADLIITCEGKLDEQTFYGKAPFAVLKIARKCKKRTLFICGQYTLSPRKKYPFFPLR
ncbi:MAG: glycerate kinase [Elusimicrobiaceae bacterium]|nr:glycerate kinase [Elusimicrobiaceae bacterium]